MVAALVFAVLTSAAAPSPSPLPIIITTKSSPICQALREKIAPALARAVAEDGAMLRQRPLGTKGYVISALAANWIEIDKLLSPDSFFHSDDPAQNANMESLREELQKVADDENNALNILSGAYYTEALEQLSASGPQITFDVQPNFGKASLPTGGPIAIDRAAGALEDEYLRRQALTQRDELVVAPMLQPLIAQCKTPSASP
jgi:hypothetical protein